MADLIDIFDEDGSYLGEKDSLQVHRDGDYHKTVLILVLTEDRYLLIQRKPEKKFIGGGQFDIFGGHLERGESYIHAAKRELIEELGIEDVAIEDFIQIGEDGDFGISLKTEKYINNEFTSLYAYFLKPKQRLTVTETFSGKTVQVETFLTTIDQLFLEFQKEEDSFADGLSRLLKSEAVFEFLRAIPSPLEAKKLMYSCFMLNNECVQTHEIRKGIREKEKPYIFVAMPFHKKAKKYNKIYQEFKDRIIESYDVIRSDDNPEIGYIICGNICKRIQLADFVMVFLTPEYNRNVLYECGLAFGLDKRIFCVRSVQDENLQFLPSLFGQPTPIEALNPPFSPIMKKEKDNVDESDFFFFYNSKTFHHLNIVKEVCLLNNKENKVITIDLKDYKGDYTEIVTLMEKAKCIVLHFHPGDRETYFIAGLAHGLQKPTITITEDTTALPLDIRDLYHIVYKTDKESKEILKTELLYFITQIQTEITDPIKKLWIPIIKRGFLKIILGNQQLFKESFRVAVGTWDIMASWKLISYLLRKSRILDIEILHPVYQGDELDPAVKMNLSTVWAGSDLFVLGSPDSNAATAIIMEKIIGKNEKRRTIKERTDRSFARYSDYMANFFSNEIELIHNACPHNKICEYNKLDEDIYTARKFRRIYGLLIEGQEKFSILGNCWWLMQGGTQAYEDSVGIGHVIIADNPYCLPDCYCRSSGYGHHKVIIVEGLSGPPTLEIVKGISGLSDFENIEVGLEILERMEQALSTTGDYFEYILYTKVKERVIEKPMRDEREAKGLVNYFIKIKDKSDFIVGKNNITLFYNGVLYKPGMKLNPELKKLMKKDSSKSK